jgi:hypothetical protein
MSVNTLRLLDHLFEQPVINVKEAQRRLGISFPAANGMVNELQKVVFSLRSPAAAATACSGSILTSISLPM